MENFTENLLKYKKDPLTLIHKMQQLLQEKNAEIEALNSKITFIQLPMKAPVIYNTHFIFNGPFPLPDLFMVINKTYFITLTYDPSFFLPKTEGDQVNFFIELLYQTITKYCDLFGCFEHHKSGVVHFHGMFVIETADLLNELLLYYKNKLTMKSRKAVHCVPIYDCDKLLNDYLIKEKFITIKKNL